MDVILCLTHAAEIVLTLEELTAFTVVAELISMASGVPVKAVPHRRDGSAAGSDRLHHRPTRRAKRNGRVDQVRCRRCDFEGTRDEVNDHFVGRIESGDLDHLRMDVRYPPSCRRTSVVRRVS